jgi:2-C-methyl-D-erythritol 4-phosphate cytidylyltransferase
MTGMKVQAIIVAGGTGVRMRHPCPKPLLLLGGRPVVARTVQVFDAHPGVAGVVLVVHPDHEKAYRRAMTAAAHQKPVLIVPGGATRSDSVRRGLRALDRDTGIIMVHDAVRPLVAARMITDGIRAAVAAGAAVAAVPVKATLKECDPVTGRVCSTLDRARIWEVQTPQVFGRALLERAYDNDAEATDDAALVERLGHPVTVFPGEYSNIKITTPEDMAIAEVLLGRQEK